jgi:MFS family permease
MADRKLPRSIFFIQFLVMMNFSSMAVLNLLPLFFENIGANSRQIGFFMGILALASFLSRPFVGWLLGRVNPKTVIISGLLLQFVMTCLYPFMRSPNAFVVMVRFFHGIGMSLFILAALYVAVSEVREELKTYALGVVSAGFMLPLLAVPFVGEELIQRFGFPAFFLCAIFLAAVPLAGSLFSKMKYTPLDVQDGRTKGGFFSYLGKKRILVIVCLAFFFEVALSSHFSFVPLLVLENSAMKVGVFYASLAGTSVFLRLYAGKKFKFWGEPWLLAPSFLFISTGGILVHLSRTNGVLALSGLVFGIGAGILYPHLSALAVEGISKRERGKVLSLFASSVDLGFGLGPVLFGVFSQGLGVRKTFLPFSLLLLAGSLLLFVWGGRVLFQSRR